MVLPHLSFRPSLVNVRNISVLKLEINVQLHRRQLYALLKDIKREKMLNISAAFDRSGVGGVKIKR